MPKPFKSLIIKLADKSGIAQDNPALLDLLSKIDLQADDALFDGADKFLNEAMTLDIAKKHPDVLAHYKHSLLGGVDAKIKQLATAAKLEPADIALLDAEKDSYARLELFNKLSTDKLQKEAAGATGADKTKLIEDIKLLNQQILEVKTNAANEVKAANQKAETDVTNYGFESFLGSKQYAQSELPAEVNTLTAKTLLQAEFAKRGAALIRKDGKLTLVNAANPDLPLIENNKEVSFGEFADSTLATHKLLKVSDASGEKKQERKQERTNGDGKQPDNSAVLNAIQEQLKQPGMQVTV